MSYTYLDVKKFEIKLRGGLIAKFEVRGLHIRKNPLSHFAEISAFGHFKLAKKRKKKFASKSRKSK